MTCERLVQSSKAQFSIVCTLSGISIYVNAPQQTKSEDEIVVKAGEAGRRT